MMIWVADRAAVASQRAAPPFSASAAAGCGILPRQGHATHVMAGRSPARQRQPTLTLNLIQPFQQQYRTFGSFGAQHSRQPRQDGRRRRVIDTEAELAALERALARIEGRHVRSSMDTFCF
jgi:hypothetical protein